MELGRLRQVELQAEQLMAASQVAVAQMERLLDELHHLQRQVAALRLAIQAGQPATISAWPWVDPP